MPLPLLYVRTSLRVDAIMCSNKLGSWHMYYNYLSYKLMDATRVCNMTNLSLHEVLNSQKLSKQIMYQTLAFSIRNLHAENFKSIFLDQEMMVSVISPSLDE